MKVDNTAKTEDMVLTKDGIWMTREEYIEMVKAERNEF